MRCAIQKCVSNLSNIQENEKQNISFYKFPSDRDQFQKCVETITKNNSVESLNELHPHPPHLNDSAHPHDNIMYLCSLHFHKEFIGKIFEVVDGRNSLVPDTISSDWNINRINNEERENDTQSIVKIECDVYAHEDDSINIATKYDLHNTCRTCRAQNVSLENIFKGLNAISSSSFIIRDALMYLKLNISVDDGLPQKICGNCINHLSNINTFRIECERSQDILDNYFKNQTEIDKQIFLQEISQEKTETVKELSDFEFINIYGNANDKHDRNIKENVTNEFKSLNDNIKINKTKLINEKNIENEDDYNNSSFIITITDESEHDNENTNSNNKTLKLKKRKYAKRITNQSNNYESFCDKCGKHFKIIGACKRHRFKCGVNKEYLCRFCTEKFRKEYDLNKHLKEIHPCKRNIYSCSICNKKFVSAENYAIHIKTHNTDNPLKCHICDRVSKTESCLISHIKSVHTISEHTCPHCSMQFNRRHIYVRHLKSHNPDKQLKCKYCDKSFTVQLYLENHERAHTGARPYLCNICGKDFGTNGILKRHLLDHKGERPYNCSVCKKGFVTPSELKIHMRKHTGERPYKCQLCDKGFISKLSLRSHMQIHAGDRPYKCDLCDKGFAHKSNLTAHMRSHTRKSPGSTSIIPKIRRYPCDLCNKSFELASSLTLHMKMHSEDRTYKCTLCLSAFKRPTHLRIHINGVHLKQKPYKCEVCDKTFLQSGDRNIHMRIHTGERPHKCHYCDKHFRELKAMRKHMRIHTGEKPYRCELCNSCFTSHPMLSCHTKKYHKM